MSGGYEASILVLLVGILVVTSMMLQAVLKRCGLSPLVGFLLLGFGLRIAEGEWGLPSPEFARILEFLGWLGIISLLFRIGLESRPEELLRRLPQASLVALSGIIVSGALGFAAVFYLLDRDLIIALVVATAMTATSVGLSVGTWQEAGALHSSNGELLLDVAELDDIVAILLMALLFAVLPVLRGDADSALMPALGQSLGWTLLKLTGFAVFCTLFTVYLEKRLSAFARRLESPSAYMLVIAGAGIILASLAGLLGFSFAIGAFFAGLVFSRDPEAVKSEGFFLPLYNFFSPFFFIDIGYRVEPEALMSASGSGLLLLAVAAGGKFLAGLPVWFLRGFAGAALIGVSLIPRAEITLIIMTRALQSADAVSQEIFSAMVLVSAATCLLAPVSIRLLLRKWPQTETNGAGKPG